MIARDASNEPDDAISPVNEARGIVAPKKGNDLVRYIYMCISSVVIVPGKVNSVRAH